MMLKQMCLEFLRYRWFPALLLTPGLILSIAYVSTNTTGLTFLGAAGWGCLLVGFTGNYLGFYIQPYFKPPISPLVPSFRNAHLGYALSLNAALALMVTAAAAVTGGPWTTDSLVTVFATLWCFGSISLGIGYAYASLFPHNSLVEALCLFSPVYLFFALPIALPWRALYDTPLFTIQLTAAGVIVNLLLVHDVVTRAQTWQFVTPQDFFRILGLSELSGQWLRKRTLDALDTIRHPVPNDFVSHVRLFRLNRQMPLPIIGTMFLVGFCGVRYFAGEGIETSDRLLLWTIYVTVIPFLQSGLTGNRGADFRLLSLVPLQRQDLVARLGAASLTISIEIWLTFVATAFIGALLPFGIGLKAFPSLGFLVASFATHLVIFGIVMLVSSLPVSTINKILVALLLSIVLALTAALVPSSLFPLTSVVLTAGLLWASYQVSCRSEIN
jgi:hypothetical protein